MYNVFCAENENTFAVNNRPIVGENVCQRTRFV